VTRHVHHAFENPDQDMSLRIARILGTATFQ
jgi:hypothetical protein